MTQETKGNKGAHSFPIDYLCWKEESDWSRRHLLLVDKYINVVKTFPRDLKTTSWPPTTSLVNQRYFGKVTKSETADTRWRVDLPCREIPRSESEIVVIVDFAERKAMSKRNPVSVGTCRFQHWLLADMCVRTYPSMRTGSPPPASTWWSEHAETCLSYVTSTCQWFTRTETCTHRDPKNWTWHFPLLLLLYNVI